MTTPFEVARRLAKRGLVVIPVPRPGPGLDGKTPKGFCWLRYQNERPTTEELENWFTHDPMNLAVLTGALSGVVVVDVDSHDGWHWAVQHLPHTPWKTRTAKGVHLWYQHPGGHVSNRVRLPTDDGKLPIDVRADGGYVMAPGSLHASGVWYRCAGDWRQPRAALPRFSSDWLPRPIERSREEVANQTRRHVFVSAVDHLTRARAYLAAIPRPDIGHGSDHATFTAACRLVRGFELSQSDAEQLLWEWAGGRPGWDRAWIERKVANAQSFGAEEIGALL